VQSSPGKVDQLTQYREALSALVAARHQQRTHSRGADKEHWWIGYYAPAVCINLDGLPIFAAEIEVYLAAGSGDADRRFAHQAVARCCLDRINPFMDSLATRDPAGPTVMFGESGSADTLSHGPSRSLGGRRA